MVGCEVEGRGVRLLAMWMTRSLSFFAPAGMPMMSRPSYRRELVTSSTVPVVIAMFEGGVIGVLARKGFGVGDLAFASILAAPFFANATSVFWTRLAQGRPKVKTIRGLQVVLLLAAAGLALFPTPEMTSDGKLEPSAWLEWSLVAYILGVRCLVAGVVTLRSTLWRQNYPRAARGRVTSRLIVLVSVVVALSAPLMYQLLDRNVQAFRIVYPLAACIGAIGVVAFSGIRLRGERVLLRDERDGAAKQAVIASSVDDRIEPAVGDSDRIEPRFWSVLQKDKTFRSYMIWQFVMGFANLMGDAAFITIVIELVKRYGGIQYSLSTVLTVTLPFAFAAIALPFWARYLDRVHIVQFRTRHTLLFVAVQLGYLIGASVGSVALLAAARVLQGVARGGGMLAWNLGHNDFADRRLVSTYMSVHVTLTGVRGFMAPFIAVLLMNGWAQRSVLWGWDGLGAWTFAVTAGLAFLGWVGFVRLYQQVKADGKLAVGD